ncbi:MAG: LacI family transcriptional regulator [Firmicutes bacterium]|nr:LacI family transcriptional regulator [Bacillota bacterium]
MRRAKVTLKDIARETGFTINTVSRALKNKEGVAEDTRRLIHETARRMGYITNSIAGALRSGETKTIAVIIGDISNPHFSIMVKELENAAKRFHYSLFVINTDEDDEMEYQAIYNALSKKVDGIIICPTQKDDSSIELMRKNGIPFVLLGRRFDTHETDYVIWDDLNGGFLATKHLIETGRRRILYLNGPSYISSSRERLMGYQKALREAGLPYIDELVHEIPVTSGECHKVISELVRDGLDFDAVFAFSDIIAFETIWALNECGIRVPEDVAVVGFDNIQSRLFLPVPLTTVSAPKSRVARRAMGILLRKMRNKDDDSFYHEIIDTHLVVRGTT